MLEAQELENAEVHRGMKAYATLVWPQGAIELDSVAAIDLTFAFVVLPYYPELYNTLWDGADEQSLLVVGVFLE